jgi:hypothetical protein
MEGSGYSMLVGGDKQSEGQGTDGGRYYDYLLPLKPLLCTKVVIPPHLIIVIIGVGHA